MSSFKIIGGERLSGEIVPQGAKNEALQVICAVLLTEEEVLMHNVPDILDVNRLIDILVDFGVRVEKKGKDSYLFQAKDVRLDYLYTEDFYRKAGRLRGSVMLMGPLLARFGKAFLPKPGGDKIGRRRLDTHFLGMKKLNANFTFDARKQAFDIDGSRMRGDYILLDEASVTGTANLIMAAVLTPGETIIFNAATEPYLLQLSRMLVSMGADIQGLGSNRLIINGVERLNGTSHRLLADMIEVGSFMGLAAMTASEIRVKGVIEKELGIIPEIFKRLGLRFSFEGGDLLIHGEEHYEVETFMDGAIMTVADAPWPGFTPDLISIALVTSVQAKGSVLIHQKMFESRLFFVDKLIDMGAQIILCDPHRATVIGLDRKYPLRGIRMSSPDIRAGVALLIAALSAEGESIIDNIEQIDRGYQHIDERLRRLGARIERIP